ncbi:uncharacterized protein LOC144109978 [Amblyomma americanum]
MGSQQFCLKWRPHPSDDTATLDLPPYDERPMNVTLVGQGFILRAHKEVLSAFSTFFREQFIVDPSKETILIPNGVNCRDLQTLVEFMYRGEAVVEKGQLPSLPKAVEALQVKGRLVFSRGDRPEEHRRMLANMRPTDHQVTSQARGNSPPPKRQCLWPPRRSLSRTNQNDSLDRCTPSTTRSSDSQRAMFAIAGNLPSDYRTAFPILTGSGASPCAAVSSTASTPSSNHADSANNSAKSSAATPCATKSVTSGTPEGQNADRAASTRSARDTECQESSRRQSGWSKPLRMFSAVKLNLFHSSSSSEIPNSNQEHVQQLPGISTTRCMSPKFPSVAAAPSCKDGPSEAKMTVKNLSAMTGDPRRYQDDKREATSSHLPDLIELSPSGTEESSPSEREKPLLPSSTTTQSQHPQDSSSKSNTEELMNHGAEQSTPSSTSVAQDRRRAAKKETKEAVSHRPVTRSMTARQQKS